MPFVEVYSPPGSVPPERRDQIAQRLVAEVMRAEGAPDTESARAISWLVWHDLAAWSVGGRPVAPDEPPRYVVRVTVPAGSMSDAKRADVVARVTRVLADTDPDPERFHREPAAFVLVDEVPEGAWGAAGRVVRFPDIVGYVMTGSIPQATDAGRPGTSPAGPPAGPAPAVR